MTILVLNAGSSSLKFGWYDKETLREIKKGSVAFHENRQSVRDAVHEALRSAGEVAVEECSVVGHRIVHGGIRFQSPVIIDAAIKRDLHKLSKLAPLHNPPAIEAVEVIEEALPEPPQMAVFDTAFFAGLSPKEYIYPVPYEWHVKWGIRRFGFHGISHSYCASRASDLLGKSLSKTNLVICHLGNGCSATAIQNGEAIATTMGFTPLEGLMMGTRSGSIDPGLLLFLEKEKGLLVDELEEALNHKSGLWGVSGLSSDFREIEKRAQNGHEQSKLAFDMYADRIQWAIAGLSTKLKTLDAVVFTAGVGENSATLRTCVIQGMGILGLRIDLKKNETCVPDQDIASPDSQARVLVIHTDEERMIARETKQWLHMKKEGRL